MQRRAASPEVRIYCAPLRTCRPRPCLSYATTVSSDATLLSSGALVERPSKPPPQSAPFANEPRNRRNTVVH